MKKIIRITLFAIELLLISTCIAAAQLSSIAGDWDGSMSTPSGNRQFEVDFKLSGEKLTGVVRLTDGEFPLTGKIQGSQIEFVTQYSSTARTCP